MANRLTIKGQVTIPKEIRDFLNLTSGDSQVEFAISADGTVSLRKAEVQTQSSFEAQRSSAKSSARSGFDVLSLLSGVCI